VKLTTQLHLVPNLRIHIALPPHSPYTPPWHGSQLKHRGKFTFTFTILGLKTSVLEKYGCPLVVCELILQLLCLLSSISAKHQLVMKLSGFLIPMFAYLNKRNNFIVPISAHRLHVINNFLFVCKICNLSNLIYVSGDSSHKLIM